MEAKTHGANRELEHARDRLRELRDEVRLQIHLAKMDLKEEWRDLETGTEDAITDATTSARERVNEMMKKLERFVGKLQTSR